MYKFSSSADQNQWDTLMAQDLHWFETRVRLNNVYYTQDQIFEMSTEYRMFSEEQPTVGSCLSAEITLKMLKPYAVIPRMAKIEPFVRVTNGTTNSAWMPQGVFWIDTREESKNDDGLHVLTMHGYDAMLKTEAYFGNVQSGWPKTDLQTVNLVASTIGVSVDARTTALMTNAYSISAPISYTMRETLANIGAMYAGNWIITVEGKLLLVSLADLPKETSLLVDGSGNIITFGEDAISLANTAV